MALLIMKKLLLILPILLVGCGQSSNQELNFPDSSYGKAMKCANDNYFSFYEKMTGDSSDKLERRVSEYCFDVMSETVNSYLYTGTGNLKITKNNELSLSQTIRPVDDSKVLNHLLYKMRFNVTFVADTLKEDECVEGVINFYGTHVVDNDEDNSFYNSELLLRDIGNQPLYKRMETDKCFAAWIEEAENGAKIDSNGFFNDNIDWSWSIKSAEGLFFTK